MTHNVSKILRSAVGSLLLLSGSATGQTDQERSQISNAAQSRVQADYSQMQPAWFDQFLGSGNCEHMGLNHPDWNICMAGIATWTNHKMNPQLFGPLNMHLQLLEGVSTQVENVSVNGSIATALVVVSGTCKFTDESKSCVNTGDMPKRAFRTKVRVTLSGSGLFNKQWQVVRTEEDPAAAQARKQALASEIGRRVQTQQNAADKMRSTQELLRAVENNDQATVTRALQQGADPNMTVNAAGMTNQLRYMYGGSGGALHLAIQYENVAMVRLLLEHGANPNQRGGMNTHSWERPSVDFTPLRQITNAQSDNLEAGVAIVSALISKGADPKFDNALQEALQGADDTSLDQWKRDRYRRLAAVMQAR